MADMFGEAFTAAMEEARAKVWATRLGARREIALREAVRSVEVSRSMIADYTDAILERASAFEKWLVRPEEAAGDPPA